MTAATAAILIQNAQQALSVGASDVTQAAQGNLNGKKVIHWSYYVLLGGVAFGSIVTLAAGILGQNPTAIGGGLFIATNGLGAYYIREFSILTSLKEVTDQLTQGIKDLFTNIVQPLASYTQVLEVGNAELNKQITDQKRVFKQGELDLAQKAKDLDSSTDKLLEAEAKLKMLQDENVKLKASTDAFTASTLKMDEDNKNLVGKVADMEKELKQLDDENAALKASLADFEKANQDFTSQNGNLDAVVKQLQAQNVELEKNRAAELQEKDKLQKQVDQLSGANTELSQSLKKMQDLQKTEDQANDQLVKRVDSLSELQELSKLLPLIKKLKLTKEQDQALAEYLTHPPAPQKPSPQQPSPEQPKS